MGRDRIGRKCRGGGFDYGGADGGRVGQVGRVELEWAGRAALGAKKYSRKYLFTSCK